jgi:hypothetical protein
MKACTMYVKLAKCWVFGKMGSVLYLERWTALVRRFTLSVNTIISELSTSNFDFIIIKQLGARKAVQSIPIPFNLRIRAHTF